MLDLSYQRLISTAKMRFYRWFKPCWRIKVSHEVFRNVLDVIARDSITKTLVKIENFFKIKNFNAVGQAKDSYSLDSLK